MLQWCKNRSQVNLIIDAFMFIMASVIAGIGLLLKYVLLPGRSARVIYGERTELFYLGLNRHDWGAVHFWAGLIFILLLIVHIILHWRMIGCIFRRMFEKSLTRWILIMLVGIVPLLFVAAPLFITPDVRPLTPNYYHNPRIEEYPRKEETPEIKNKPVNKPEPADKLEKERGTGRRGGGRGRS